MRLDAVFILANLYPLPFWALMIFAPHWQWTRRICSSLLILLPLAIYYAVLLVGISGKVVSGEMPDLTTVVGLTWVVGNPEFLYVGWIHYLVFDLFVGRWAYFDSRERHISAWWVSPTLVFIYLAGPLGLLFYLGVRLLHNRREQQTVS